MVLAACGANRKAAADGKPPLGNLILRSVLGQNPNASRTLACQLSPAPDKPPHSLYSAMCQEPTYAVQQSAAYSITCVGARVKHGWYGESERFCGFQVDDHFEGCRLDYWEIGRFLAFEDASCIATHFAIGPLWRADQS
jgi:hypothetical protein